MRTFFFIVAFLGLIKHVSAQSWLPLTSGVTGFAAGTEILQEYQGELYVGGVFTMAGGAPANYLAKWNGAAWSALSSELNGWVYSMAVYNGKLYVGGTFSNAGGLAVGKIARWDGSNWERVGTTTFGFNSAVLSLEVYNGDLYAGGKFSHVEGLQVNHLAKYNDATNAWTRVGTAINWGTDQWVHDLEVDNGELYIAGRFSNPGNKVVKWNGTNWTTFPYVTDGSARTVLVYNGDVYLGTSAGFMNQKFMKFDGTSWSTVANIAGNAILDLSMFGGSMVVSGHWWMAGAAGFNNIALFDGTNWTRLGTAPSDGTDNRINSAFVYSGVLYAGGTFDRAGTFNNVNHVARWTGIAPMPVELITFEGQQQGSNVLLEWTTATELNNDYFHLERAGSDLEFEPIAKITGAGTTTEVQHYSTFDETPFAGVNYYRLRQVDFDGAYEYSDIIAISYDAVSELQLYPNPSLGLVNLHMPGEFDVVVQDVNGRIVMQTVSSGSQCQLQLNDQPSGVYIAAITTRNTTIRKQFILE